MIANDHFAVRNGVRCAGAHLIIDLHGAKRLDDIDHIEATLRRCVDAAKATLLHIHLHHFQPNGVSGVAVLAESHISIHTWPEVGYAALDVFMCGTADPDKCIPVLREAFSAERVGVNELLRGQGRLKRTCRFATIERPGRIPAVSIWALRLLGSKVWEVSWPRNAGYPRRCSTILASA